MIESNQDSIPIDFMIKLQRILWWVVFTWFLSASLISIINLQLASKLSMYGVILIILMTVIRIIAVSGIMIKIGSKQTAITGYLLLVVLASTVLVKYLIQ